jgi:mannitol-1-/sugar-/sorbitol-6-phosphatase
MSVTVFDCDAVLFDMDGTLVDSREIVERMWKLWAAEHGLPVADALALAHGRRTIETMQLLAPHLATPEEAARLDALEAEQEGGERAIQGASELLSALPENRWAVVTSAGRDLALRRLALVGLRAPSVLVSADDVVIGKPSPEGYRQAAERLGVDTRRSVVIEDTPAGVEAGRSAGARVIGLTTTYQALPSCDVLVSDLRAVRAETPIDRWGIRLSVPPSS